MADPTAPNITDVRAAFKAIDAALAAKSISDGDADRLRLVASVDPAAAEWALKSANPATAAAYLLGQLVGSGRIKAGDQGGPGVLVSRPSFY